MVWRPARLTRGQLEERRLAAARLLHRKRWPPAAVAREAGGRRAAVPPWHRRVERAGVCGRRRRRSRGRPSRLTRTPWRQVFALLEQGAVAVGFAPARWTRRRIAAVSERTVGVRSQARSRGRALRAHGWRPQHPSPRARERAEARV